MFSIPWGDRLPRAAALSLTTILLASCGSQPAPALHARLQPPAAGYVLLKEPVQVSFDRTIKGARSIVLAPPAEVTTSHQGTKLLITPVSGWQPGTTYSLKLQDVTSTDGADLKSFATTFRTQPRHGVAGFLVGGRPVTGEPTVAPGAHVTITFTDSMNTQSAGVTVNGQAVPTGALKWADDAKSVDVSSPTLPYQKYAYALAGQPQTASGEVVTDLTALTVHVVALEPSNSVSGIGPGYRTTPPTEVVIEDAADSRPQSGLQRADLVFEYISEYGINRMTALYFNQAPQLVGPVRSCRIINAFLVFAFQGVLLCSGVSDGTAHYIPGGGGHGTKAAAAVVEDQNAHQYFFRGPGVAPHNLYTSGDKAASARAQLSPGDPSSAYLVDAPHADAGPGQPADPPTIPLQRVGYRFDPGLQEYLRYEGGAPFLAAETGSQLRVKNIAVMHVPFHYTNWSEDGCCTYGVWYDLLGTGPAELYSAGRLVHATWHLGTAGQQYSDNNTPIWFSDDSTGQPVELNTGVTWVHVVGNGQTG